MTAIEEFSDNKNICQNICRCSITKIEYLIGVDNIEAINIKTGKCLRNKTGKCLRNIKTGKCLRNKTGKCPRCSRRRLNEIGIVLKGKI